MTKSCNKTRKCTNCHKNRMILRETQFNTKKSVVVLILIQSVISLRKKRGENLDTLKNILNNDSTQ